MKNEFPMPEQPFQEKDVLWRWTPTDEQEDVTCDEYVIVRNTRWPGGLCAWRRVGQLWDPGCLSLRAAAELQAWRDVIATICRDGGHYHQKHGTKATRDACIQMVLAERRALAEKDAEIERLACLLRETDTKCQAERRCHESLLNEISTLTESLRNWKLGAEGYSAKIAEQAKQIAALEETLASEVQRRHEAQDKVQEQARRKNNPGDPQ